MRDLTRTLRFSAAALAAGVLLTAVPSGASAQYFGRNKVQYKSFHFEVLSTQHFNVYYYPSEQEAAQDAARMAERWYARLSDAFQHAFQDKKPIILYANDADFQQTNAIGGFIDQGTGGVTEGLKDRLVMPIQASYHDTDHVVGHEMTHEFQYDLAQSDRGPGAAGMNRVPTWMIEGMAEYMSKGRLDALTTMWMRDAVLNKDIPSVDKLTDPKYFPYRFGEAIWAYVGGEYGDRAVPALFNYATEQGMESAARRVLGLTMDTLSAHWIAATKAWAAPTLKGRTYPDSVGHLILAPKKNGVGDYNLAPAMSPDGKYVAYISDRGLFSLDLYLADAATGKVIRPLVSSATNTHFDALSFMNSAGSFSPDEKSFATVVFSDGVNRIALLRVSDGHVERTLKTPGIGGIADPAWSPDGETIAFSGNKGGIWDLYTVDLKSGEVRQLTHGRATELQPEWSPDGRQIAYTTDKGEGTNFETLTYGPMRIDVMDLSSGQTQTLPLFDDAKNINPNYSPDGHSLYFLSDEDGVPDVFRYSFDDGNVYRVTHVATGVSGLTEMSPALAVARHAGTLAFSVFNKRAFEITTLTPAEAQGTQIQRGSKPYYVAGTLPPSSAAGKGVIYAYLHDAMTGLPLAGSFKEKNYAPKLSLDAIAPPSVGVATSTFGTGIAGGVAAYFSDMLGNQQLGAAISANGTLKDIGGEAIYQNMDQRWNWGAFIGHIPLLYLAAGYGPDPTDPNFYDYQELQYRIYIDQAAALLQYPLSETRRFEFTGGFTRYAFNLQLQNLVIAPTGQIVDRQVHTLPSCGPADTTGGFFGTGTCAPSPLYLAEFGAAYVGDNSIFGFTSPINGGRFRFEVSPTLGTINYVSVLGDYRKYLYHYPFTLAMRAYHYGRYGTDAESSRLQPLYVGYQWFVRGYEYSNINPNECSGAVASNSQTGCPLLDNLLGSRLAVANVELRVPVLGVKQFGLIDFPYLPTEISAFFDAGMAWGSHAGEKPDLTWERNLVDHAPATSTGVSIRSNILGFLILEAYYVYPFQRPLKGWHWGFQVSPGW